MLRPWAGNKCFPTPFFFIAIIPPPLKSTLQRGIYFIRRCHTLQRKAPDSVALQLMEGLITNGELFPSTAYRKASRNLLTRSLLKQLRHSLRCLSQHTTGQYLFSIVSHSPGAELGETRSRVPKHPTLPDRKPITVITYLKRDKSTPMSASHPSNIDVVETLGEGLKHVRSSVVKEEQP